MQADRRTPRRKDRRGIKKGRGKHLLLHASEIVGWDLQLSGCAGPPEGYKRLTILMQVEVNVGTSLVPVGRRRVVLRAPDRDSLETALACRRLTIGLATLSHPTR